jgi:hypothetical protein
MGVATNSTEEVGRIYLDAIHQHVPDFAPTAYLGDAAMAFANAAMHVFATITIRLMCFAHVYKAIINDSAVCSLLWLLFFISCRGQFISVIKNFR